MSKTIRIQLVLAATALLACAAGFAQSSGQATYKAKCQNCHGPAGQADTAIARALKVKPATDPVVRKFTEAEMIAATKNGMGKMQPYKESLTDAQIKDAVGYFRTFSK
jgi:mono/diheme cytochrome c family protein